MNFIKGALGADVSFYQDNDTTPQKIDFVKMKAAGVQFVILRGGQNTWVDEDFKDYVAAVKTAGLAWGTYWFYDSRSHPADQATLWRNACGNNVPKNIFIDLEESYGGAYGGEMNWKKFVSACQTKFPDSRITIYTANWWWNGQIVNDPTYWAKFPLWVATYAEDPSGVVLPLPWRNKQAHIWQWTDRGVGSTYGVESSRIDLNYWNNTYNFGDFWGGEPAPPPPPPSSSTAWKVGGTNNISSLNIRSGAGTSNAIVGTLFRGDVVEGVMSNNWIKISKITRVNGTITMPGASWWCSGYPAYVTPISAPSTQKHIELKIDGVTKVDVKR
jgi:GH25 family lysozyme M1 (1,4-beta-N-acetylmuramidase)